MHLLKNWPGWRDFDLAMHIPGKDTTRALASSRFYLIVRIILLTGLIGLVGWFFILAPGQSARAEALAAPAFQATDYPFGTGENGYSGMTDTPASGAAATATKTKTFLPGTQAPQQTQTSTFQPIRSVTVTLTATLPPNVFRTEDSEINGAQATPALTETPGPTITNYVTGTVTATHLTPTRVVLKKSGLGFQIDWGMFWIGFSVPVLFASGVVLYFIDRRPDLFAQKH